jgi:hypothetical protein
VIAALAFWRTSTYFANRRLAEGRIGKVRVLQVDPNEAIAILDFTLTNATDQQIVVRSLQPSFEAKDGTEVEGHMVAVRDIDNIFRNYPNLGEQYNPALKAQDVLPAKQSIDRMAAVRFDVPEADINARKGVVLRVDTNGGVVAEIKGK